MYSISFFKHRSDARACAREAREAAPDAPRIVVDRGVASRWWTVCIDKCIGKSAQAAIKSIATFVAKIEIVDPDRARAGCVRGKWMDPRVYLAEKSS